MAGRKSSKKPASTFRNKHGTNHNLHQSSKGGRDLQSFTHWDTHEIDETANVTDGGWSAEDMFKKNMGLGVSTTFKDDLTQYTTCVPVGNEEQIAHANRIAREIEKCEDSKRMEFLENDDEERDLDKETVIPAEAMKVVVDDEGDDGNGSEEIEKLKEAEADGNDATEAEDHKPEEAIDEGDHGNDMVEPDQNEETVVTNEDANTSTTITDKFQFDLNAPEFVPRSHRPVTYPQGRGMPPNGNPLYQPAYVPPGMQFIPHGAMYQQGFIPQGMQFIPNTAASAVPLYNPQMFSRAPPGYQAFIPTPASSQAMYVRPPYSDGANNYPPMPQPPQPLRYHQYPQQQQPRQLAHVPRYALIPPPPSQFQSSYIPHQQQSQAVYVRSSGYHPPTSGNNKTFGHGQS